MIDTAGIIERTKEVLKVSTQVKIATYFEVSNKQVTEWKKGNATPPFKKLIELAEKRGISLEWYFWGKGDKMNRLTNLNNKAENNNHFNISIPSKTTEDERINLEKIAKYIGYTPRAFIEQTIIKMQDFKMQCDIKTI